MSRGALFGQHGLVGITECEAQKVFGKSMVCKDTEKVTQVIQVGIRVYILQTKEQVRDAIVKIDQLIPSSDIVYQFNSAYLIPVYADLKSLEDQDKFFQEAEALAGQKIARDLYQFEEGWHKFVQSYVEKKG